MTSKQRDDLKDLRDINDLLREARDMLDQRYISDPDAPALVKEIDIRLKHKDHGRGDALSGPDDSDCICRGGPLEAECASTGCGFCISAQAMKAKQGAKCIVEGCTNHRNQGQFHEHVEICIPCWNMITTGKIGPSSNFIADLKETYDDEHKEALRLLKANGALIKERDAAHERGEALGRDVLGLTTEVRQVREERDAAHERGEALRREAARLADRLENARNELGIVRAQLAHTDTVVTALEDKVRYEHATADSTINDLAATITAIADQRATFRGLLEEVLGLMDHQGISTSKHRDRIRDALKIVPPPMDTPMNADFEAWREENECKRCEAKPDAEGTIRHSKGCYVVDANGGGTSSVDPYKPAKLTSTPSVFAVDIAARYSHDPATCENCRGGWGHPPGYANVTSAAVALKDPYEANPGARPQPHPGTAVDLKTMFAADVLNLVRAARGALRSSGLETGRHQWLTDALKPFENISDVD